MLKVQFQDFEEVGVVKPYPFDSNLFDNVTGG